MLAAAALIIVVCDFEPGELERCGLEYRVPLAMSAQVCERYGLEIASAWMAQDPSLEFTFLTDWRCDASGEEA